MDSISIKPIKKLSQDDIDRIAAGEVIQRPRNAIKELIENSLDAGATSIDVTVKFFPPCDFKLIKIKDNGHGFRKEDLPLACERFATSKLEKYDDLLSINTFGFRGEALASISRVARVTITSRPKDSIIGYQMDYEDGMPRTKEPLNKAANPGTIITISDLFHNDKKRKSTLPNTAEEYNKIAELISLYSLDNLDVSFRLSKDGSSADDVRTTADEELLLRVKNVMGSKVANNLIPLKLVDEECKFEARGLFGDLNSSLKSYKVIIFVNNRLVECAPLKKAIESFYKSRLPKGSCPFVLVSLVITAMLDVNIHPTKQEVRFDYEERVISSITNHMESVLTSKTTSNVGSAQSFLRLGSKTSSVSTPTISRSVSSSSSPSSSNTSRPDLMNRSNHSIQTIDSMVKKQNLNSSLWREVKLSSVHELRKEFEENVDRTLKTLLNESTYVGLVLSKEIFMLIQSGTSLFSLRLEPLTRDLFYQKFLTDFGNFGMIELENSPSIESLLLHYRQQQEFNVKAAMDVITPHRAMIDDYFSVVITNDNLLQALPIVINGHIPNFEKLPRFLYDLAFAVDWASEKKCFRSFGESLATFYSVSIVEESEKIEEKMRDHLFPIIQKKFKPSSSLKKSVFSVTNVPTLYKVFHRC